MNNTPLETHETISYVNWFELEYPGVLIHAIPNGLFISHRQREKAVAEGLRKGPSDLHVPRWHLYVEMKRQKGGAWSNEQKEYKKEVELSGGVYLLCKGFAEAKKETIKFAKTRL